jgi:hypothetical protein
MPEGRTLRKRGATETRLLFEAKDHGDVAYLLNVLRDPRLRFMAAKFLGELRAAEAVRPLIRLLGAGDRVMRSSAAEALAAIGEREAVPALIERLLLEKEVVPRTFVITALGNLGDDRALEPLCNLLTADDILVRQSAANALGQLGRPEALESLRAASAKEKWYDRGRHRQAMKKLRGRRAA